jgi:hypothetical protein
MVRKWNLEQDKEQEVELWWADLAAPSPLDVSMDESKA